MSASPVGELQPRARHVHAAAPPLSQQVALVSGANRGLGLEVVHQLAAAGVTVLLGARDADQGERAAQGLRERGADVTALKLDVTCQADVDAAARHVQARHGRLDILVNNAGAHYDVEARPSSVAIDAVRAALDINLLGAWRLSEAMVPLMRRHGYGRIVNVSSGCGATTTEGPACPAYRVSKSALNTYTRALAADLGGTGILVNAVCPGWVATDMGGPGGRPVAEGAEGIVWAACLPEQSGASGGFYRDHRRIAW